MRVGPLVQSIAIVSILGSGAAAAEPIKAIAAPILPLNLSSGGSDRMLQTATSLAIEEAHPTSIEMAAVPAFTATATTDTAITDENLEPDIGPLRHLRRPPESEPLDRLLSQNTPANELPEPESEPTPLPEQTPVLPESLAPEPSEPEPTTSDRGDQVMVNDIQVVGSSVFDDRDFDPIVSAYEGRNLGLPELREVADAITNLYLERGYITSRAVLSEQTITQGVVQVRVIEGELETIQVEGTQRLAGYVRDRINLANRKPLSQVALESQLQLLRSDPLLSQIEASLRAGTGEGQSQLIVRVVEAPALSGRAFIDTHSPESVGIARTGLDLNYNNLLGLGDRLSLSASRSTAGGSTAYSVSYGVPLNAMNGTLEARYMPSTFKLVEPSLAALGIEGSSDTYELTYRQPIIRQPSEELALSLGFRHRAGETLLSNVVIDSTRTSVFQFGQDYLKRDRSGAWGLRSQFNLGTGLLDATTRDSGQADGQFFSWLGQVQRAQVINRDNLLLLQGSLQLSANSLLGADQFIIGGANSVRGYSQNARFGDNGFRASIEDRMTVLHNENGSPAVQIAPFLDMAGVWNNAEETSDQRFLMGTGVSFITNLLEDVQARLDVGIPLIRVNESGDSNQDVFLYFNMDYRF
jgi:hemolysin activation/secretion protein